jgi:DNA polymerase-3 subunit epsilon
MDTGLFCYSSVCPRNNLNQILIDGVKELKDSNLNLVGFDVETTGLSPKSGDRIVAVGAVKVNYETGQIIDNFGTLVNPNRDVGATFIHGITDEDVRDAPQFKQIYSQLLDFFKGSLIVGHNLRFDEGFLASELALVGDFNEVVYPSICTLKLAQRFMPDCVNHKLDNCAAAFDIKIEKYHDATCDALASVELLRAIINDADLAVIIPQF